MKKQFLLTSLIIAATVTGCTAEVTTLPDEPGFVDQNVKEEHPEDKNEQKQQETPEPVKEDKGEDPSSENEKKEENNGHEDNDLLKDYEDQAPVMGGANEISFVRKEEPLPKNIYELGNYDEDYFWDEVCIDMDKDGLDEKFILVELNEPVFADLAGDLWFEDGEGNASIIGTEDYLEYYSLVGYNDYGSQVHVAISYTNGIPGGGYVFGYNNKTFTDYSNKDMIFEGNKKFSEDGKLITWKESYEGICEISPELGPMWYVHTWVPYRYSFNGNSYKRLSEKEISLEEVQSLGDFDAASLNETEPYRYILSEDMLIVDTLTSETEDDVTYENYYVYFYTLDDAQKKWILKQYTEGIYHLEEQ